MRLGSLIPIGFAIGAALCALMLRFAPHAIQADLAQPLAVVTYWHRFGALMFVALAIAVAIASVGYVAVLRSIPSTELGPLRRSPVLRYRSISVTIGFSLLACGCALLFPVVFSSDVYAYAGYGDMALHGLNPYAHGRIALHDPVLDAMLWQWGNPPPMCVYGPLFVWIAQAVVAIFGPLGAAAPLWALRVLSCVSLAACAPLAYVAFSSVTPRYRGVAAAGIALNPIAIWSAAEGHNDALALAIVLAGFAIVARGRAFAGALVVAISATVKAPGAVAAVALAVSAWRDGTRFARLAAGAAIGIAIVAALAFPLEYGVRAHLLPQGHYLPQFSMQYVSLPLTAVLIIALIYAALRYLSVTHAIPVYLAFAAWMAIPNPYPWYAVWLLPVAFLAWPSRAAWALVAASLLIALRYYAEATTAHLSRPLGTAIVAVMFGVPLVLLIARTLNARRVRRENRTAVLDFATSRLP
jgi:hypothetical protein